MGASEGIIVFLVGLVVVVGLFAILRALILWYFRLDEIAENLKAITKNTAITSNNIKALYERLEAKNVGGTDDDPANLQR